MPAFTGRRVRIPGPRGPAGNPGRGSGPRGLQGFAGPMGPPGIDGADAENYWPILQPSVKYQAGTWTPAVSSSGGTNPTFSTAQGTFTNLGRLVFFNGYLDNTSGGTAGSGTQQLSVSLPFPTSAAQLPVRVQIGSSVNGAVDENVYGSFAGSTSTMLLWKMKITGSHPDIVALTNADFNDANTRQLAFMTKILTDLY